METDTTKIFKYIWEQIAYFLCVQFLNNIPEFYKNVLISWIRTVDGQLKSPLTFSNVRKQIVWGNKFITFENKYLFFKEWIISGIFFVNDIIDTNGKIRQ